MKNRALSIALRITVSCLLIIILLYIMRGKYAQIGQAIMGTNPALFALALLIYVAAIVVASFRFKLIIDSQGHIPVTFRETTYLTFIGYFFSNFLPTAIGGDVVKAYYLSKKTSQKLSSYTTVFVDRFIGLATMIFMAFAAIIFFQGHIIDQDIKNKIYIITAVAGALLIIMASKKIASKLSFLLVLVRPFEERLKGIYNAIHHYRNHKTLMIKSFAISIISQLLFFSSIGVLALSLSSRISMLDILMRIPVISMMSLLPSINGFGPREFSTKLLFAPLIGDVNAIAVSILWDAVLIVVSLIGGLIYLLSPKFRMDTKPAVQ